MPRIKISISISLCLDKKLTVDCKLNSFFELFSVITIYIYLYPRAESNCYLKFRKLLFYPLNYEGNKNLFYYNFLFTSNSSYPSIMSPTFMSLKFSIFRPHSCPTTTSLTSSLKRFSEASFPVYTTIPSLITRTLV